MTGLYIATGAALVAVALVGLVWGLARRNGRLRAENERVSRRIDAMREKREVTRHVETQDDSRLVDLISKP